MAAERRKIYICPFFQDSSANNNNNLQITVEIKLSLKYHFEECLLWVKVHLNGLKQIVKMF